MPLPATGSAPCVNEAIEPDGVGLSFDFPSSGCGKRPAPDRVFLSLDEPAGTSAALATGSPLANWK